MQSVRVNGSPEIAGKASNAQDANRKPAHRRAITNQDNSELALLGGRRGVLEQVGERAEALRVSRSFCRVGVILQ